MVFVQDVAPQSTAEDKQQRIEPLSKDVKEVQRKNRLIDVLLCQNSDGDSQRNCRDDS